MTYDTTALLDPVGAKPELPTATPNDSLFESTILIVDDEPVNIKVVRQFLRDAGYTRFQVTNQPADAVELIQQHRPDVVILDIMMPRISGLDILRELHGNNEDLQTAVIVLTASSDPAVKLSAFELGATDFLAKPVDPTELVVRVRNVLRGRAYQNHLKHANEMLEQQVRRRTRELERSRQEVIHCLARAAEFRDDDTGHHVLRVGRYARIIAEQIGYDPTRLDMLEQAAQLHDVGKIGVPDAILLKPGKLTPDEFEYMQKHCGFGKRIVSQLVGRDWELLRAHTEVGASIFDNVGSPVLRLASRIALTHHERWDGSGYPLGLAGENIPLEGRITAVADVFDALSSKRPYKQAFPLDKCFSILREGSGSHFDPAMIDAFFMRQQEIVQTQIDLADLD